MQGVGFRYRATQIARTFAITGYVKNLPDGGVELVAEGEEEEIKQFLERLQETMSQHILECKVNAQPITGEYDRFGIRY